MKFLDKFELVEKCIDYSIYRVFKKDSWNLEEEFDTAFDRKLVDLSKKRWCHINTEKSGGAMGIAIGYLKDECYIIDLIVEIEPTVATCVVADDLLWELKREGYEFAGISIGPYQYKILHGLLCEGGFDNVKIISVDKTMDAYNELKSAIYENRIRFYRHGLLMKELSELEYIEERNTVDHAKGESKNMADSIAGAVWGLCNFTGYKEY